MLLKRQTLQMLAWIQLIFSVLLAAAIASGYATYRAPLGHFIESLSASVIAVSKVVEMTAETVASREQLVQSTKQTLMTTRSAIQSFRTSLKNQAKQAPQLANEIRAASAVASRLGNTLDSIANGLMFSAPTGIQFEGLKPVFIMSRPLANDGRKLKSDAQNLATISNGLLRISTAIAKEGQGLGSAFDQQIEQTLKLLEETENTLDSLQKHELPDAVKEMRDAADNLRVVSKEVDDSGSIGAVLLIIGLLVSGWCFLNSLGQLMLANQISIKAGAVPGEAS
jgi:hypothetical protein